MEFTPQESFNISCFAQHMLEKKSGVCPNGYILCPNQENDEMVESFAHSVAEEVGSEVTILQMDYPHGYGLKYSSARGLLNEHAQRILETPHPIVILYVKGFDCFYADGKNDKNEFKESKYHYWKQHYWDQGMVELNMSGGTFEESISFRQLQKALEKLGKRVGIVYQIGESSNGAFDQPEFNLENYALSSICGSIFAGGRAIISHSLKPSA